MQAPETSLPSPAPLAWEPEGNWVAFSRNRSEVEIEWVRPEHAQRAIATLAAAGRVDSLSISRSGDWLACGCGGGEVIVWKVDLARTAGWPEASRGRLEDGAAAAADAPTLVAFSPVDDSLAVARGEQVLLLRVDPVALQASAAANALPVDAPAATNVGPATDRSSALSTLAIRLERNRLFFRGDTSGGRVEHGIDIPDPRQLEDWLRAMDAALVESDSAARDGLQRSMQERLLPVGLLASGPLADDDAPLSLRLDESQRDVPWELILGLPGRVPLGVTRGLVREAPGIRRPQAPDSGIALVVACPRTDARGEDPSLTRSAPEADAVADAIERSGVVTAVQRLRRPGAQELVEALLRGPIRLLFIAGDGSIGGTIGARLPVLGVSDEPGVAVEPGFFLTRHEFAAMRELPELVFLSCGRLSRLAPALLQEGAQVVVAPLWNVEPEAAATFSGAFFASLLAGDPLIWATQRARAATYSAHPESVAWAAFQVRGDPAHRWLKEEPAAPVEPASTSPRPLDIGPDNYDTQGYDGGADDTPRGPTTDVDLSRVLEPSPDRPESETVLHAEPGDLLSLEVADGPVLVVTPETAKELLATQASPAEEPAQRGFLGNVMLSAISLLRAESKPEDIETAVRRADAAVDPGVYVLDAQSLVPLKGHVRMTTIATTGEPAVVFVHGLMADTASTFAKLWELHPRLVAELYERRRGEIYALESATLGTGPIEAARILADALPSRARVSLLTHGSGGLVAEILARCAAGAVPEASSGIAATDRETLLRIAGTLSERAVRIERIVRVAAPMRGDALLSKRPDLYMSLLYWARQVAGLPMPSDGGGITMVAARHRDAFAAVPGIAALAPESPLIAWLGGEGSVPGDLRVIAGNLRGGKVATWLKTLLADSFYVTENDLIVPTASMYGGAHRSGGGLYLLDAGPDASHFNYFASPTTASAAVRALLDEAPSEFRPIGPLAKSGQSSDGSR